MLEKRETRFRKLQVYSSHFPCCEILHFLKGSDAGPRMTEFYDDYIESYRATPTLPAPPAASTTKGSERGNVANWARTNANPNNYPPSAISRAPSRSSPSATGLRRKHTRNQTAPSRSQRTSSYEEEEGYASGDYEELSSPLAKIRIKVCFSYFTLCLRVY